MIIAANCGSPTNEPSKQFNRTIDTAHRKTKQGAQFDAPLNYKAASGKVNILHTDPHGLEKWLQLMLEYNLLIAIPCLCTNGRGLRPRFRGICTTQLLVPRRTCISWVIKRTLMGGRVLRRASPPLRPPFKTCLRVKPTSMMYNTLDSVDAVLPLHSKSRLT